MLQHFVRRTRWNQQSPVTLRLLTPFAVGFVFRFLFADLLFTGDLALGMNYSHPGS